MTTALNMLPPHLLEKLSFLVGGLGLVQSVLVANPQQRTSVTSGVMTSVTMTPVYTLGHHKLNKLGSPSSIGSSSILGHNHLSSTLTHHSHLSSLRSHSHLGSLSSSTGLPCHSGHFLEAAAGCYWLRPSEGESPCQVSS
jgi:hypothetical protein